MLSTRPQSQLSSTQVLRLVWLYLHSSKWIFIALAVFSLLYLVFAHIDVTSTIPLTVSLAPSLCIFLSIIYMIVSYLSFYSIEKENNEHLFAIHRGTSPVLVNVIKVLVPIPLMLLLCTFLILGEQLVFEIMGLSPQTDYPLLSRALFLLPRFKMIILYSGLTILISVATRSTLNAIVTIAIVACLQEFYRLAVATPVAYQFSHPELSVSESDNGRMFVSNVVMLVMEFLPLVVGSAAYLFFKARQDSFSFPLLARKKVAKYPETEYLPVEQSTWRRFQWLHAIQSRPILVAASVVCLAAFIQPAIMKDHLSELPERYVYVITGAIYLLFSGLFVFSPEHVGSAYRFWNDRGLSPSVVLTSRLWKYAKITIPAIVISGLLFALSLSMFQNYDPFQKHLLWTGKFLTFQYGRAVYERPIADPDQLPRTLHILTYMLLVPMPITLICAWLCTRFLFAVALTVICQVSLWILFAVTLSWEVPVWAAFSPLIVFSWWLLLRHFEMGVSNEITSSSFRTILVAPVVVIVCCFVSTSAYRVYEIPSLNPSTLAYAVSHDKSFAVTSSQYHLTQSPSLKATVENPDFAVKLSNLFFEARSDQRVAQSLIQTIGPNLDDHEFACYGWPYLSPALQQETLHKKETAAALEELLNATACREMMLPLSVFANDGGLYPYQNVFDAQELLIRTAKYYEQHNDLDTAARYYRAAFRLPEVILMSNAASFMPFYAGRNYAFQNLVSWLNHPAQTNERVEKHLVEWIVRPSDRATDEELATRTIQQVYVDYKNKMHEAKDTIVGALITRVLFSESARFERLLMLYWRQYLIFPNYLRVLSLGTNSEYMPFREEFTERFLDDQRTIEKLQKTSLIGTLDMSGNSPAWPISSYREYTYHRITEAESVAIARLAWIYAKRWIDTDVRDLNDVQNLLRLSIISKDECQLALYQRIGDLDLKTVTLDSQFTYKGNFPSDVFTNQTVLYIDSPIGPTLEIWPRPTENGTISYMVEDFPSHLILPDLTHQPERSNVAVKKHLLIREEMKHISAYYPYQLPVKPVVHATP